MTVPSTVNRNDYVGNGATTVYPYTYQIFNQSHLEVWVQSLADSAVKLAITTDYTVSGVGLSGGGNVTLNTALTTGYLLAIKLVLPITQLTDLKNQGQFFPEVHERVFDRGIRISQQLADQYARGLRLPETEIGTVLKTTIPVVSQRASKLLGFDENGNPTAMSFSYSSDVTVSNIAALQMIVGDSSKIAKTLGYYSAGGGGANSFYWDGTSTATDNGGTVIKPTSVSGAGRWLATNVSVLIPEQFGAKADGTNDSAYLAAMLLAATSQSKIELSALKSYKSHTGLTVPTNVFIEGNGATLDFSNGHVTGLTFTNGGGINNTVFVGAGNASFNASGVAISCVGADASNYKTAPKITNCSFSELGAYGVYLKYCKNGKINHNKFEGIGYAAIGGLSCSYCNADYNYIDDVSPGTGGNAYGVFWSRAQNSLAVDPRSVDCTANNNTIKNIPLWEAIDTHGGDGIKALNNTISNCDVGVALVAAVASGVENVAPKNCVVSGNIITGNNTGASIKVVGAFSGGVVQEYALGCTVTGNTVTSGGDSGNGISGAIQVYGTKNVAVTGNTIAQPYICGVQLYTDNIGFNITGNTIIDPHDSSITVPSCILAAAGNNTGYIGGNTFVFENAALDTYVAKYAIRFTPATTGNDVTVGKNSFVGIDSTHLTFSGATVAGINVSGMCSENGAATIPVTSGNTTVLLDITYVKRFPVIPKVKITLTSPITGGGNYPVYYTSNKTETGFRVLLTSAIGGTFSATGNFTVDWEASS